MSLKLAVAVLCLLVAGGVWARKLTDAERREMQAGMEAGRSLAIALYEGEFKKAMGQVKIKLPPFSEATKKFLDFFADTNELILEEIIKGFKEVNARLDLIINELREIKKLIEWKDVQVRFGDIEYRIRLMDSTLKIALSAPNRQDGIRRFNDVYEREYRNAGFALYDSVANNDQVFSKNLIVAAMKYSENDRAKVQKFSKGLYGLLVKAMVAEIAYEKFNNQNTGRKEIWLARMERCRTAMLGGDSRLEKDAWKGQPPIDADKIAKRMNGKGHREFVTEMYKFLEKKYFWRYWFVIAYDEISHPNRHYQKLPKHAVSSLRKHGRNYFIVSTDPKAAFSSRRAQHYIHNYTCRMLPHQCHNGVGKHIVDLSPNYGQARFVVQKKTSVYIYAKKGRSALGQARLMRTSGGWYGTYHMAYFG